MFGVARRLIGTAPLMPKTGLNGPPVRLLFSDPAHELADRFQHRLWLVPLRRVAAILQRKHFHLARNLSLYRFHLRHGSVLIVHALNHQHRAGNLRQVSFDVPVAKFRMEPDLVPSPESFGRIAMMARQFLRQICGLELRLCLGDAGHAQILDEHMRRQQHQAGCPISRASFAREVGSFPRLQLLHHPRLVPNLFLPPLPVVDPNQPILTIRVRSVTAPLPVVGLLNQSRGPPDSGACISASPPLSVDSTH